MELDNVGMPHLGQQAGFPLEVGPGVFGQTIPAGCVQRLDGHLSTQRQIVGQPDLAEGPFIRHLLGLDVLGREK